MQRTTYSDFVLIKSDILKTLESMKIPVTLDQVLENLPNHFTEYKIHPGRVILELLANQTLFFTEDRKISISRRF